MRIQLLTNGDLTLDNWAYVDKILEAAGMTGCTVPKGPINKDLLKIAAEGQKQGILLGAEGKALHEKYVCEFVCVTTIGANPLRGNIWSRAWVPLIDHNHT